MCCWISILHAHNTNTIIYWLFVKFFVAFCSASFLWHTGQFPPRCRFRGGTIMRYTQIYTVSPKRPPFYFWITVKNKPILMIFGMLNREKISHANLTDLSTSPVRCSHCTLRNPNKSFSTVLFIRTSDYLRYLTRKQSVIHLPTPPENVTTLICELQNFIWLKVCCVLSNVGGSEESQLWIVIGGSDKNRLWYVATAMSDKQCHSKCSERPPSALVHASSLFRHCSVA